MADSCYRAGDADSDTAAMAILLTADIYRRAIDANSDAAAVPSP
jgi:hypothetical protein